MTIIEITNKESLQELAKHIIKSSKIDRLIINNDFSFFDLFYSLRINTDFISDIKRLNIDVIDCSKATSLNKLFLYMSSLEVIPKIINTENVVSVREMFKDCESLTTVEKFDTSNVVNFHGMFDHCRNLKSVPDFNTEKAKLMAYMFFECTSLENAPKFNTKNVEDFTSMFFCCESLRFVPEYDISSANIIDRMFFNCHNLESIPNFKIDVKHAMDIIFKNIMC